MRSLAAQIQAFVLVFSLVVTPRLSAATSNEPILVDPQISRNLVAYLNAPADTEEAGVLLQKVLSPIWERTPSSQTELKVLSSAVQTYIVLNQERDVTAQLSALASGLAAKFSKMTELNDYGRDLHAFLATNFASEAERKVAADTLVENLLVDPRLMTLAHQMENSTPSLAGPTEARDLENILALAPAVAQNLPQLDANYSALLKAFESRALFISTRSRFWSGGDQALKGGLGGALVFTLSAVVIAVVAKFASPGIFYVSGGMLDAGNLLWTQWLRVVFGAAITGGLSGGTYTFVRGFHETSQERLFASQKRFLRTGLEKVRSACADLFKIKP